MNAPKKSVDIAYYPGCSLATTAKENNRSLIRFCNRVGINLVELPDWNCCGSSSAHSIDSDLALDLAARNLSLVPKGMSLLVACPNCLLRLNGARLHLKNDPEALKRLEAEFGRSIDAEMKILHFFELLATVDLKSLEGPGLKGLRFVPYYGCMMARPPGMMDERPEQGQMEAALKSLGAEPIRWGYASRCCGTFLSVARPDVVTPMVDDIIKGAVKAGAECIITACAMCHMNLEVRHTISKKVPILHFSEALSLAIGESDKDWFTRHLIDPRPLLRSKRLISQ